MTNGKNSFLQVVKLPNVRGKVRYISDPKRQENLYATFTNVESKYWFYLSKENQEDFRKSGTEGKCIEARELIIMLPSSLIQYDPNMLLKYFSAKFVEKYDVAVASALHHNKAKTNLHIHLIFSESLREELSKMEQDMIGAEKWIELIKEYSVPKELTAPLLNAMIEKILIHEATTNEDNERIQEIEIYYRFIGKVE